jgi:hypothetical protein
MLTARPPKPLTAGEGLYCVVLKQVGGRTIKKIWQTGQKVKQNLADQTESTIQNLADKMESKTKFGTTDRK